MSTDAGGRGEDAVTTLQTLELIAGGVAHDFNNLLQIIRARLDLTVREGGLSERQTQHLDVARHCLLEAETLSTQLRVLARGGVPHRKSVDLQALLEQALLRCFDHGQFTHALEVSQGARWAMLDAVQMARVFDNLLLNARQAMTAGGHVLVRVDPVQDTGEGTDMAAQPQLRIRVTDNGPGIPADIIRRIFEPDFTTKAEGTGMGLSICQGVLRRHGGRLTCESVFGQGTTFTITLPHEVPPAPSSHLDQPPVR